MLKKFDWLNALQDAFITTLFALILLGPLMVFKLDGLTVNLHLLNALWLSLIVFFGKLFGLLFHFYKPNVSLPNITLPHIKPSYAKIAFIIAGCLLPFIISKYWLTVVILAMIYILLGLGLNIVVGLAGLLNLGFAAFYAVGAYTVAILAHFWGFGFWTTLPLALVLGGLCGILLAFPVLKMQGDYLAIVTLGFGEILRLLLENGGKLTGGPNGLTVAPPTFFGIEFGPHAVSGITFHELLHIPYNSFYRYLYLYLLLFIVTILVIKLIQRIQRIPLGRAWEALREDEIAARSLGINHVTTKLSAFCLGAMIGSLAGAFFAGFAKFVNPASFTFVESAMILAIVVLGGMGRIMGIVIAALLLSLLPELLREFSDYRMLIFGIAMVLMMIWRPYGLFKIQRPQYNKEGTQLYER